MAKPRVSLTTHILSDWHPVYEGIDRAFGTADIAFDSNPPCFDSPVPRKQCINALRIDLANESISFYTTPSGGKYQTLGNTITGFMGSAPNVMVAVNANFSWCDQEIEGGNYSLMGLAVSEGSVVCNPAEPALQPSPSSQPDVPDQTYAGAMAMLISRANQVTFQYVTHRQPEYPSDTYTAIAGSPQPQGTGWPPQPQVAGPILLVENGINKATPETKPTEKIAARTSVGLSRDGQYLYLATLDGCERTPWPYGSGFYDIAQWMILLGAATALNLDGGGSTAMACRIDGKPILMNVPFGTEAQAGVQRAVGNFFGVIAQPLSADMRRT